METPLQNYFYSVLLADSIFCPDQARLLHSGQCTLQKGNYKGTASAEFTKPVEETKPEVVETVPEITEPTPEEKPKSTNMLPAILTLIVLACGGGFFVFKKVQEKKKEQGRGKACPGC